MFLLIDRPIRNIEHLDKAKLGCRFRPESHEKEYGGTDSEYLKSVAFFLKKPSNMNPLSSVNFRSPYFANINAYDFT